MKTYNTYILQSDKAITTVNDVHAILTYAFENFVRTYKKGEIPKFKKIDEDENNIVITTVETFSKSQFQFQHNKNIVSVKIIKLDENPEKYDFNKHDRVIVHGKLSYSKNLTKPIFYNGKKINSLRVVSLNGYSQTCNEDWFSSWFEQNTGVRIEHFENLLTMTNGINKMRKDDCKKIKDAFYFEISGQVVDEGLVNSMAYCSIGRARTYGFGAIFITKAEK